MARSLPCIVLLLAAAIACLSLAEARGARHPIFSSRPQQYASKFLKAIEPLHSFHITHSDGQLPLAGFHPDAPAVPKPAPIQPVVEAELRFSDNDTETQWSSVSSGAAVEDQTDVVLDVEYSDSQLAHWSVSGAPHLYHKGLAQLFPDRIQLHFTAFGEKHSMQLHVMRDLYNEESVLTAVDGDGVETTYPHVLQSYWSVEADKSGWSSVTLHRDGKFQAVIHKDGDTIQIDPVSIHEPDMSAKAFAKLHKAAHHHAFGHPNVQKGLVVHRHSDFQDLSESHKCGAKHVGDHFNEAGREDVNASQVLTEPLLPYTSSARRLLQVGAITNGYGNFPTTTTGMSRWTSCWRGENNPQRISVGFAVDSGMYAIWGSVAGVQQYIAWQMSVANLVYLTQLSEFMTISDTVVLTDSTGDKTTYPWNDMPPSKGAKCTTLIDSKLSLLSTWRNQKMAYRNSIWNLQTNCYPPSGTVGLAWIGTVCNNKYATSISTYSTNQWLTTAHEIGHNHNAQHTFQLGQGSTGGIMDYGDGKYKGIFAFNTDYSKTEMCQHLDSIYQAYGNVKPYCTANYAATCGNGVVEPGEACDDTSSCCQQPGSASPCQLATTSQCSGETPCCTACKFKPSSTTCQGGKGICTNGFCAPSACTGYSGLSFCGMVTGNACRQQCLSSSTGVCSSAYNSPNLNVADGTVCGTAPYSTCSSGVCVASGSSAAPAVTYSWSTSDWSACSCSGSQSRSAYCVGSDGSVGTEGNQCPTSTKPSLTQSCSAPSSCITYAWTQSAFSSCSVDCGGGIQTATVQCKSSAGAVVADTSCTATKPATTQSCNSNTCPSTFVYSSWSSCSVGCGGGLSTRSVTCQQTQNGVAKTVTNSYCTGLQATSQACNTQACVAPTPVVTFTLTYGTWGTCSATCGTGTQTRPPYCTGSDGITYDLSKCGCGSGTSTTTCPQTVQACNTATCPSYAWNQPSWGTCSVACGGGVQTRNVQCINSITNGAVADTNCVQSKPSGVQNCNTQVCSTYTYTTGLWQPCSKLCGGGVQTRAVSCVNQNNIVSTGQCSGTAPAASQTCNAQACPTFQWLLGQFTSCSSWCGGGTQTRSVRCVATGSLSPVSFSNCDTSNIPASAQYCNTAIQCPLNSQTQWVLGTYSDCSSICGGDSVRSRTVTCKNSTTGLEVDPMYCPADYIPEVQTTCANVTCPTYWYTGDFSQCSANCMGGTQTRKVECRYQSGSTLAIDDALCTGTRPSQTSECNLNACPSWVPAEWSACSARCGDGVQTRRVDCVTWDNQNTTASACASAQAPPTQQVCNNLPCPHWHRGPWSVCDKPCGGGNQTRALMCRMPHDDVYFGQVVADDTLCPAVGVGDSGDGVGSAAVTSGRPPSWELCNTLACPTNYWDVVKYSDCSAACGSGTQTGTAVCKSAADGSLVANSQCLGDAPAVTRTCNDEPCPAYDWRPTTAWSNCSVVCGSGTQSRTVRCVNTNPAAWKNVPFEIQSDDSACSASAKLPTLQACNFPNSVCFGNGGDANKIANGLCTSAGQCLCRAGYAGTFCDQKPTITNVYSNGASFTSGIPFGEKLFITWDHTGSLPYVSILLTRDHAANASQNWPVASYIAQDIINTGSYSWSVGERMSDLESGDGFSVQVWFSNQIYAENAVPFKIGDPCDYKSCGTHGICVAGGVCQCIPGYSGDVCSIGPCERAHCSTSFGSCSNDDYIGKPGTTSDTVGVCLCGQNAKGFYDGFQCRTPPGCTAKCKNGADLFNVIVDLNGNTDESKGQCGLCGCTNLWQGDDCGTCGLQCQNGGKATSNCTQCDCSSAPGFFGSQCTCKYYSMTLSLDLSNSAASADVAMWTANPLTNARFARTLAIDLALAVGEAAGINVEVNVVSIRVDPASSKKVLADVRLGLECPRLSEEVSMSSGSSVNTEQAKLIRGITTLAQSSSSQAFSHIRSPSTLFAINSVAFRPMQASIETGKMQRATTDEVDRPTLLSVYNLMAVLFADLSSAMYRGVITSSVGLSSVVSVSDPSGQDTPALPAKASDPFQQQQAALGQPGGFTNGQSSNGSSLSIGAIIGIAVGGAVLVAILVLAALFLYRKSTHHIQDHKPTLASQHQTSEAGTELQISAAPSPADTPQMTPHTTPPQQSRQLAASPSASYAGLKFSPPIESAADYHPVTSPSAADYHPVASPSAVHGGLKYKLPAEQMDSPDEVVSEHHVNFH